MGIKQELLNKKILIQFNNSSNASNIAFSLNIYCYNSNFNGNRGFINYIENEKLN